eukprot:8991642-Heterocapsa_arctica.AAC.1
MSFLDAARNHIRFVYAWHAEGTLALHSPSLPVSSAALPLRNRPSPKSPLLLWTPGFYGLALPLTSAPCLSKNNTPQGAGNQG